MDSTTTTDHTLSATTLFVRRGLEQSVTTTITTAEEGSGGMVDQQFGLFIFLVAFSLALSFVLCMAIRRYFTGKSHWRQQHSNHQNETNQNNQIQSDEELAQELQRQLNEESREQDRLEKRKERRDWYVSYIKPYTMVSHGR